MVNMCMQYHCRTKLVELDSTNDAKLKIKVWPWPLDHKINRGPPQMVVNTIHASTWSIIIEGKKMLQLHMQNQTNLLTEVAALCSAFPLCNRIGLKILDKPFRGVIKYTIIINTFSYDDITLNLFHIWIICENSAKSWIVITRIICCGWRRNLV